MIAALPKAPSRINPITSPERALERRNYVLNRMLELAYINEAEFRCSESMSRTVLTTTVQSPKYQHLMWQKWFASSP